MPVLLSKSLTQAGDTADWIAEGHVEKILDPELGTILSNGDPISLGDHAHWTYWLPQDFPSDVHIEWDLKPLREPGLCMVFFAAQGINGRSIFDGSQRARDGYYPQYHSGDINAYHISYFRHKLAAERAFRTCNLRKSHGFHFILQGADPLPPVEDVQGFYHISVKKIADTVSFSINDLQIFTWHDDGQLYGPALTSGKIGFRQMAPMKAAYKNLRISTP